MLLACRSPVTPPKSRDILHPDDFRRVPATVCLHNSLVSVPRCPLRNTTYDRTHAEPWPGVPATFRVGTADRSSPKSHLETAAEHDLSKAGAKLLSNEFKRQLVAVRESLSTGNWSPLRMFPLRPQAVRRGLSYGFQDEIGRICIKGPSLCDSH